MFKKGGVVWIIWNVLFAALFVTLGIITCINSGNPDFQNVIILIAGILVIVDASLRLLALALSIMLNTEEETLRGQLGRSAVSSSELAIGILLILVSQGESAYLTVLFQYLAYFIGILLIVLGSVALLFGIVFLIKKVGSVAANILGLFVGALLIVGGILVLIYANQEALLQIFFVFFGIMFVLIGVALLVGTVLTAIQIRRFKAAAKAAENAAPENQNAVEGEIVEAPAEEPKEEKPVEEKPAEAEEKPEEPEDKPE